jgi:hypothetical protein
MSDAYAGKARLSTTKHYRLTQKSGSFVVYSTLVSMNKESQCVAVESGGLSKAILGRRGACLRMAEATALHALYSRPQRLLRSNHFETITGRNWPGIGSTSPRPRTQLIAHSDAARPIESELMYA